MKNQYGHFSNNGSEFIITTPNIPRHWYNYMWNDTYNAFTSQVGFGESFVQDSMGRRVPLVANRLLYLLDTDNEVYWTANALPVHDNYNGYQCTHGLGYSEISLENLSIGSSLRFFVPEVANCEIWTVRIKNNRSHPCNLKVIPYIRTEFDGSYKPQGYNMAVGWYDHSLKAIIGKKYQSYNSDAITAVYGYMTASTDITGYDSAKNAFIGTYGEEMTPDALASGGCRNSACNSEKLCFALEASITLESGAEREIDFIIGFSQSVTEIETIRQQYFKNGAIEREFENVAAKFSSQIAQVTIQTPDEDLNRLFNYWIKHQANMGSRWARVRHNGFRDLTQDTECLGSVNPNLSWQRLKRIFTYQYSNGYAPRTFLDGQIKDNNFSDNTVWLTFAVYSLLMEIGDLRILEEEVAFNDGTKASVYLHIKKSVEFLWNFRGLHGLIKIWCGDWNDSLDRAGMNGKGVSIWLSMAWYKACRQFAEIARLTGRTDDAEVAGQWAAEMKQIVNATGWDGEYYLTVYTDDDIKLGSMECEEAKIFLIPQLWAIYSDIAEEGKGLAAMKAVDKYLETDLGTLVNWPSYTKYIDFIGRMTTMPAGVNENGGVYLHPSTWKLIADSMLKRNDKVQEGLEKILPFNDKWVTKKCEPYIMCNCYFTEETGYRYAVAGQTWRTASGSWLVKALVQYIFGLQPTLRGLRLNPCLPPSWKNCSITKNFRGAKYHITYIQTKNTAGNDIIKITVNGDVLSTDELPYQKGEVYKVEVLLG